MVRKKKGELMQFTGLILALIMIVLQFMNFNPYDVGVYEDCPHINHFTYQFFHTSFIHLGLNLWVFLSILFFYNPKWYILLSAYLISCWFSPSGLPTLGLSGVIYALFGFIALRVRGIRRFLWFTFAVLVPIVIGYFFTNVNAALHLYCYLMGLLIGYTMFEGDD